VEGRHGFIEPQLRQELTNKWNAQCAAGILNAPDPSFDPSTDNDLIHRYSDEGHVIGKQKNKEILQQSLGLIQDKNAPVFFWPSRLDPVQKGCQLLAEVMYGVISTWWGQNLQIVFVANGDFRGNFENIVRFHGLENRVAMCDFDEKMARLAYAASDFILMPSLFEPCGLPQMIAPLYGSLPIAHDTGGIHDTIEHLNLDASTGNGFLFNVHDSNGLFWAIREAMNFFNRPPHVKAKQIARIMKESKQKFNHGVTAGKYIDLYEKMLKRPLII
jgi:starch synthase/alpha-amylase